MGEGIVIAILSVIVALAIRSLLRGRRSGGCCGDCGRCHGCNN